MSGWRYYDDDWTGTNVSSSNSSDTASNYYYISRVYVQRILVESPEHWTERETLAFADLINHETQTGWQVTMIIKGEILIIDPEIETRSMENFLPLLKKQAGQHDSKKIDEFFTSHPLLKK